MDHLWNNIKTYEEMWMEQLENERNCPEHEFKQQNIELLTNQLESIRKALKEISKWI